MRAGGVTVIGSAIMCAALLAPAVSAGAASHTSACQRLKGKDLAPAKTVRLVQRRNADGGRDLVGCGLPRGRLRTVASGFDAATSSSDYTVRQVAGATVLLHTSSDSQYGSDSGLAVVDIRTGRGYDIARTCARTGGEPCGDDETTTAAAAFITPGGRAAAAILSADGQTTVIAAFDAMGRLRRLDTGPTAEIPAASLALRGRTVTWTHGTERRSATLRRKPSSG